MATIHVSSPLDMHNRSVIYGTLMTANATTITIVNGSLQGTYQGSFSYDTSGNVYGTLTGYTFYMGGLPLLQISGLNVSANYAASLIQSNQIQTLFQVALAGNDRFTLTAGTHIIDGYGGYNTVAEPSSYSQYVLSKIGGSLILQGGGSFDTLYNIQGVYFSDGFYNATSGGFSSAAPTIGFAATDMTISASVADAPVAYSGPVAGLQKEYISVTSDNLNVSISSDNWFIHTGSGTDAVAVHGGTNVIDGGMGSNFLTGGSGFDTFFVDDRSATSDIWSTVANFHSGDAATIWGITAAGFTLSWQDNQGATGYTGLTLHASAAGRPITSLTLSGFSQADLNNGRLSVSYGSDPTSGSTYMYVSAA